MRFSIAIPQFDYDGFDAPGLRSYLARAEELGFEGGWVLEQTVGPAPLLAPLELLSYCAACTERLRLGVAVLVTSLHEPLQLASAVTAVDRLSHGRLELHLPRAVRHDAVRARPAAAHDRHAAAASASSPPSAWRSPPISGTSTKVWN